MIYFHTNWGAKEPQNLPNHRVVEHLKMDGWNTILLSFWDGLFLGAMLVLGRVLSMKLIV